MKQSIGIGVCVMLVCLGFGGCFYLADKGSAARISAEHAGPQQATMDNYSFAVGVWCAYRVIYTNDWRKVDEGEILHAARQFSQTNGWLPFNNQIGFRGDEIPRKE